MKRNKNLPLSPFSTEMFSDLKGEIEIAMKRQGGRRIATFDADGTLWDTDIGENFFDYQVTNCNLALPIDPWKHYEEWTLRDSPGAYLWLAQISCGRQISEVEGWAEKAFLTRQPFEFHDSQRQLIDWLHQNEFEVYVVSASVEWAVVPGAIRLGIPRSRILGIKTKVSQGVVTEIQDGLITWREGKAKAILEVTGGVAPLFASGNTLGDQQLLQLATGPKLAVCSRNSHEKLAHAEEELQQIAQEKGWFRHRF